MDAIVHLASIIGALIAAGLSLYVSNRQLKLKEEMKDDMTTIVRENCASQDSFNAHVAQDAKEFEGVRSDANRRHDELRDDIAKVERRVDTLISGARP